MIKKYLDNRNINDILCLSKHSKIETLNNRNNVKCSKCKCFTTNTKEFIMIGKLIGTGSYVPENVWDNNKIAEMVDTNDEWIRERTGIIRRHISDGETTSYMAIEASKKAIEDSRIDVCDIDVIIVCTISPDVMLPTIACKVQEAIGAKNAFCYDMNVACSGFVFAYNTVLAYMESGIVRNALIVGAENLSSVTDWTDRGTCILFGDGAGAAVITKAEGKKGVMMHSDGYRGEALTLNAGEKMGMNGQEVFKFAVKSVPEVIEELLGILEIGKDEIDYYILHQANARIVDSVSRRLKVDIEKFPMNLNEYGNTSSASIPILLDELKKNGTLKENNKLVMAGFGAGLSWGASYITT